MKSEDQEFTTHDGRKVTTIGALKQTRYNGERCYAVLTSGDHDAYFSGKEGVRILHTVEYRGVRETWYIPDQQFVEYAEELDRMGAWAVEQRT